VPLCPSHTRRSDSSYGQDMNKCQRRDRNRRPPATGNLQRFRLAEHQTFNNSSAKQLHNSRRKETETPRNGSRNLMAFRETLSYIKSSRAYFQPEESNPHHHTNLHNQQHHHHVALHCLHAAFGQGKYHLGGGPKRRWKTNINVYIKFEFVMTLGTDVSGWLL